MRKPLALLLLAICLLKLAEAGQSSCQDSQYIIPYSAIDYAFDTSFAAVRGKQQLDALIENPNGSTAKDYIISIAPFSVPLFVMAGVTLAIFIATIVQVCCFNSCGKGCCGNQITSSTYNVCCMRTMVAAFLIISFFAILVSIAAIIVNSDMTKALDFTQCSTQNIVSQMYDGNNNPTMLWSGVNNFQVDINSFAVNIQNDIPFLLTYFSASNPSYTQIINQSAGSSYSNSQVFNCQNSNTPIACPFPGSQTCPAQYQAQFNAQFCNASFKGSAANLIQAQMSNNSTTWLSSTTSITSALSNINISPSNVQSLVNEVTSFTTSVSSYESSIQSGMNKGQDIIGKIQIALYVFYSFILVMSLFGIIALCMSYFCNQFKCNCFMYFFWYIFFLLAFLLFITAGFFLTSSIFTYDSCLAYSFYFQNQTNYQQLNFVNTQIGDIFQVCFFKNSTSMFAAFNDTTLLTQFATLYSQYQSAVPSNQFSTVVTTIENKLLGYKANPNTVNIQNVATQLQPSAALNALNLFANYSTPNTTQSCKLTQDYFTYDVVNCGPYLINQPVGNNSCVVLFSPNISTIQSGRVSAFTTRNCNSDASTYQTSVDSLIQYGYSISAIVTQLAPISQTSTAMQNYQSAYFNYYSNVLNFYNQPIQQTFNGFFQPYNSLQNGSNCGFVTSSMNSIVNIACNQLFPYINITSALNISLSVFVFVMFLLAYFLTTRLQFYQFLDGNFDNFGSQSLTNKTLQDNYEIETANSKNIQLLPRT